MSRPLKKPSINNDNCKIAIDLIKKTYPNMYVIKVIKDKNDIKVNELIEKICKMPIEEILIFRQQYKKTFDDSFRDASSLRTAHKHFLLCIITYISEREPTFTSDEYSKINYFLHSWEEDAFGELMVVSRDEPLYIWYYCILQAIYGDNHIPEMGKDETLPISNSYIIGAIIPALIKGCQYKSHCRRENEIHIKLMHSNEKKEGGKRRKRSSRKRSSLKRKTRRTHKN